jgi:hypothetical protein
MRRLDHDQTARIEAKGAQAVAMWTAIVTEPIGWDDEEERVSPRQAGKKSRDEAEGRRGRTVVGHDLMQSAASKAAQRQVTIDGGETEREGLCGPKPFHPGQ